MDEYVRDLLQKWELEELIPKFGDEEVNEKAFKCLTEDIIRELIPKLGKRAIFNKAYKEFREQQLVIEDTKEDESEYTPEFETIKNVLTDKNIEKLSQADFPPDVSDVKSTTGPLRNPPGDTDRNEKQSNENLNENQLVPTIPLSIEPLTEPSESDLQTMEALRSILNASYSSSHLLNKDFLTPTHRKELSDEVIKFLYNKNEGNLSAGLLTGWARAVEFVFTDEVAAIYFRQSPDGSRWAGKLYDSYQRRQELQSKPEKG
ncbi:uncharacterized protein LOC128738085 [Sabethes cyaneus]|uniref:uncharacterized protein LOC128738085 n=1 Tax=Sabethes cyaneus TaxID=53552 RepID=UPI00237E7D91|nr:uncharacterized protein LOC128738085 [Sabethes cyaneus]